MGWCLNGRVESNLFSGATFLNLVPAKVDEGAKLHEGNPGLYILSFTRSLPFLMLLTW